MLQLHRPHCCLCNVACGYILTVPLPLATTGCNLVHLMQVVHVDLFVADRFTGWRERALVNLSQLYDHQSHSFPANVSEQIVSRVSSATWCSCTPTVMCLPLHLDLHPRLFFKHRVRCLNLCRTGRCIRAPGANSQQLYVTCCTGSLD